LQSAALRSDLAARTEELAAANASAVHTDAELTAAVEALGARTEEAVAATEARDSMALEV